MQKINEHDFSTLPVAQSKTVVSQAERMNQMIQFTADRLAVTHQIELMLSKNLSDVPLPTCTYNY